MQREVPSFPVDKVLALQVPDMAFHALVPALIFAVMSWRSWPTKVWTYCAHRHAGGKITSDKTERATFLSIRYSPIQNLGEIQNSVSLSTGSSSTNLTAPISRMCSRLVYFRSAFTLSENSPTIIPPSPS